MVTRNALMATPFRAMSTLLDDGCPICVAWRNRRVVERLTRSRGIAARSLRGGLAKIAHRCPASRYAVRVGRPTEWDTMMRPEFGGKSMFRRSGHGDRRA